ncbi:histidinol dehydrogenase [Halorientalis regularis]|uniref:Histidinol dehydrogenase n=1 Tax=Halorientalis regularis TaxID=660518 RepID=A0A1G7M8J7_9EURY|nr:histidinol dehydrogenase [Halorientalis regularis]SDF57520.1 histidinol dehydrogenase/sulfopropanediol 3-dehydrogenase [Halorientalis regularis]
MSREYLKEAGDASLEIPRDVTESVRDIVDSVREDGDEGLRELTRTFDDVEREELRVSEAEIDAAAGELSEAERRTIDNTIENVQEFHEEQRSNLDGFEREVADGVILGTRLVPIERAGVYVPGGRKPLVAAPAMTIVPAVIAGVGEVVACAPPQSDGSVQPAQLYAMDRAGADEIYVAGGAQAIAAMAYGTETIPSVDKVTGPGNVYVIEAKRQVYGHVGIDFLAGPTEVLIVADESADPEMVATDLLAQAEHDPRSRAALVATDRGIAEAAVEELHEQLPSLRTEDIAEESWEDNGEVVVVDDREEAAAVANDWAPEHLQVMTDDPRDLVDDLRNYGSLFLGHHAPVVFGDKAVGTNHTLPTLEVSRYSGGINVTTYLKVLTHQELTAEGADAIAPWAAKICELEGTHAHQISAEKRITSDDGRQLARDLELESSGGVDLSEGE